MKISGRRAKYQYDVAFSYAGEDREYVERVARAVEGRIRIFYDRHEQVDLWGKNLQGHLAEVYGEKSRLCVMFLSRHYAGKVWTNHEREIAQARAYREHQTFILPARFDDTVIPETLDDVAYADLRSMTPEEFAELLIQKVRVVEAEDERAGPRRSSWLAIASAGLLLGLILGAMVYGGFSPARQATDRPPERALAAPPPPASEGLHVQGRDAPKKAAHLHVGADGPDSRVDIGGSVKSRGGSITVAASHNGQVRIARDVVAE